MSLKLGIQLYSVREAFKSDPWAVLEKLSSIGYRYLEAANHNAAMDSGVGFGIPAAELRDRLESLGLKIIGSHINPLLPGRIDSVLDYHQALGNTQIGCDIEFFPYGDLDFIKGRCELFNRIGEKCASRGMRFYYHNHYQEFQRFCPDDTAVYDYIMANTDPELVKAEMDTYWIARGGCDPVEYIKKYSDRLILIHQKDFPADAPQPLVMYGGVVDPRADITPAVFENTKNALCFTEIGGGTLPIQSYIDAAKEAPMLEYIILEQDYTQYDELVSVQKSMEGFRRFKGVDLF